MYLTNSSELDIGRACNARCHFCFFEKMLDTQHTGRKGSSFPGKSEFDKWLSHLSEQDRVLSRHSIFIGNLFPLVPLDILKAQIRSLQNQKRKYVDITGGEPLLHPDISKIIEYCTRCGILPRIITNGVLLGKKALELHNAGLRHIEISIHGYASNYERILHIQDSWNKLRNGISKVVDLGWKLYFNTCMVQANYMDLERIAEFIVPFKPALANFLYFIQNHTRIELDYYRKTLVKFSVLKPYCISAVNELSRKGIGVNVRYVPFCVLPGMEKHIVGINQHIYDPYEWLQQKLSGKKAKALCQQILTHRCIKPPVCSFCNNNNICDGINKYYHLVFGDHELIPDTLMPKENRKDPNWHRTGYREVIKERIPFRISNKKSMKVQLPCKRPKISFHIPAFNRPALLYRAIKCVQNQSDPSWELIIVSDGPSESNRLLVKRFADDSRISYLELPAPCYHFGHPSRDLAIRASKGTFVYSLNEDNVISIDFVKEMFQPDFDIVTCAVRMNDWERNNIICSDVNDFVLDGRVFKEARIDIGSFIVKTKIAIKNGFPYIEHNGDWRFFSWCLQQTERILCTRKLLAYHN